MKSPPYLVYLGFALKVNCASVQFIHNKVTLKAVNHFNKSLQNVGPILYECTRTLSPALFNRN